MKDNLGIAIGRLERVERLYWLVVAAADWPDLQVSLELTGGDFLAAATNRAEDGQAVRVVVANRESKGFTRLLLPLVIVTGRQAAKILMDSFKGRESEADCVCSD